MLKYEIRIFIQLLIPLTIRGSICIWFLPIHEGLERNIIFENNVSRTWIFFKVCYTKIENGAPMEEEDRVKEYDEQKEIIHECHCNELKRIELLHL